MPADAAGQRVALVAAATSGFLTPFMGSAVTIALPAIAAEFRLGAVSLAWVTSAFLLAAAALLLPFGRLADIVGRRRVFIAGLVVFTVATLLCAIAPSGEVLIALRLLQGAGGALIFGTGTAILTSVYPRARLGRALGIAVACVYLGLSLGPFVGGLLTAWVGWRGIFPFTASLAAGAAVLVAAYLRGEWAGVFPRRAPRVPFSSPPLRREPGVRLLEPAALVNYSATFGVPFLLSLYFQFISGPGRRGGRPDPRRPTRRPVAHLAAGRLALGPYRAADRRLRRNGPRRIGHLRADHARRHDSGEPRVYGIASGILGTMRLLGQMLSMTLILLIFSLIAGHAHALPALPQERPRRFRRLRGSVHGGRLRLTPARERTLKQASFRAWTT